MNSIVNLMISPDVLIQEVGDEIVLLDLSSSTYYGLNRVGACVFKCIKEGKDFNKTLEILLDQFEVEREELERDLSQLLEELLARRLVRAKQI